MSKSPRWLIVGGIALTLTVLGVIGTMANHALKRTQPDRIMTGQGRSLAAPLRHGVNTPYTFAPHLTQFSRGRLSVKATCIAAASGDSVRLGPASGAVWNREERRYIRAHSEEHHEGNSCYCSAGEPKRCLLAG
jgi:hypothetical protein